MLNYWILLKCNNNYSIIKIIITAEAKCYVLKRILFQYVIV